ncbi:MAG: choice-of-anchor Q domain-containing protein [bacterium]
MRGFNTDILGISRPQGKAWDIGPYEYVVTSLSAPRNLRIQAQ